MINAISAKILILLFILLFVGACSQAPTPQTIYIPIKCKINRPARPTNTYNTLLNTINVLKYIQELEQALIFCVGEKHE